MPSVVSFSHCIAMMIRSRWLVWVGYIASTEKIQNEGLEYVGSKTSGKRQMDKVS